MRALFISPNLNSGGAERQWSILIPGLRELGLDVAVLTLAGEGRFFEELRSKGVAARCAMMTRRTDLRGIRRAISFSKTFSPDIVVTWSVSAQAMGQVIAWLVRAPHVTTEHTPCDANGRPRPMRLHRRLLLRAVARHVTAVVAVTRRQIPGLEAQGFDVGRIRVIPNGVEEPVVNASRSSIRSSLGFQDSAFVVALIANLRPEKQVAMFVSAVIRAHEVNRRIRAVVAGGGPEFDRIQRLAAGREDVVKLLGHRQDVPDILRAADLVCLASRAEGMPMVLIEAMALGRPILATAVGGNDELVVPGETGLLVSSEEKDALFEALVLLSSDGERLRAFGERARARYEEYFRADRMIQEYARTFDEVQKRASVKTTV